MCQRRSSQRITTALEAPIEASAQTTTIARKKLDRTAAPLPVLHHLLPPPPRTYGPIQCVLVSSPSYSPPILVLAQAIRIPGMRGVSPGNQCHVSRRKDFISFSFTLQGYGTGRFQASFKRGSERFRDGCRSFQSGAEATALFWKALATLGQEGGLLIKAECALAIFSAVVWILVHLSALSVAIGGGSWCGLWRSGFFLESEVLG
jgi:hypothetical protein